MEWNGRGERSKGRANEALAGKCQMEDGEENQRGKRKRQTQHRSSTNGGVGASAASPLASACLLSEQRSTTRPRIDLKQQKKSDKGEGGIGTTACEEVFYFGGKSSKEIKKEQQ